MYVTKSNAAISDLGTGSWSSSNTLINDYGLYMVEVESEVHLLLDLYGNQQTHNGISICLCVLKKTGQ